MFNPMVIAGILLLYVFIVSARNSKSILRSLLGSFIIFNVINLDNIKYQLANGIIGIVIFEIIYFVVSFIVLQLIYNFANMNRNIVLYVLEFVVAILLVLVYYYIPTVSWLI